MRSRFLSILVSLALAGAAAAQPTALTYQGRLKNGGEPASGLHDFRFRLFDAVAGGTQLGSTQCLNNVTVADGLFTSLIDFGQQFASPDPRFLEIQVREDTGLGCGNGAGFVTLNPRQPLTAAPLASHANSAFALDAADGGPQSAVFVDSTGNVGIGTSTPSVPLHIRTPGEPVFVLQDTGPADQQSGYIGLWNGNPAETGWFGFGTPGSPHMTVLNQRAGGNTSLAAGGAVGLTLIPSGRVGIGTTSPVSTLDVRGDIRLGTSGQLLAPGGEENLRMIRGLVLAHGTKGAGAGFTCSRTDTGLYLITFTTPFAQLPTVTVSADQSKFEAAFFVGMPDNVTVNQSEVFIASAGEGRWDRAFHFIAVGPR
jgi:hypothetical protein